MKPFAVSFAAALTVAGPAFAEISVTLQAPWTGDRIPDGQHCVLDGGQGATPPMQISGVPDAATRIVVEFNDKDFEPLSTKGGHGIIAFAATAGTTDIPSVPGLTADMPDGVQVLAKARTGGDYASDGYLPPCSGGQDHLYTADIFVLDAADTILESAIDIPLGRY